MIKTVLFSKKILVYPVRFIVGSFRLIFKVLFYKIIVKIYYQIFRLRNNGLIKNSPIELLWRQPIYIFVFILVFLIFFSNLTNTPRAEGMETKIRKTVMSNLVKADFSSVSEEELIEEKNTPVDTSAFKLDKYVDDSCTLEKQNIVEEPEDILPIDSLYFNEESDLVFKPQLINNGDNDATSSEKPREEIIYYTVQAGDTVSTISRRFGITVNTVLWANDLSAFSLLRIGDRLTILPQSGVLYTVKKGDTLAKIAQVYEIELEKILSCNSIGSSLSIGQKLVIPGAKKITVSSSIAKKTKNSYTGISIIKDLIKPPSSKPTGNKMAWPAGGHRISQYFSWRHPGLDIANKVGTPIYASDSGVVIISQGGYNGGYGNTIVVDHGGGKKTRYGHASKLFVKVGDVVEKGETIAAMGSTGRSTGSHLHFEVIINGSKYNPLSYIK